MLTGPIGAVCASRDTSLECVLEYVYDISMTSHCGYEEGRPAIVPRDIDTSPSLDELADDFSVALPTGIEEGRLAIVRRDIDTSPSLDELADDFSAAN